MVFNEEDLNDEPFLVRAKAAFREVVSDILNFKCACYAIFLALCFLLLGNEAGLKFLITHRPATRGQDWTSSCTYFKLASLAVFALSLSADNLPHVLARLYGGVLLPSIARSR